MSKCRYDTSEDCNSNKDCLSCILDKIRVEIVDLGQRTMNDNRASGIWACRDILDKYKTKTER